MRPQKIISMIFKTFISQFYSLNYHRLFAFISQNKKKTLQDNFKTFSSASLVALKTKTLILEKYIWYCNSIPSFNIEIVLFRNQHKSIC